MTITVQAARLENLKFLVKQAGSAAEFNRKISRDSRDPYVYMLVSGQKNENGTQRSPGIRFCREVEKALGLENGWMSQDNSAAGTALMAAGDSWGEFNLPQNDTPAGYVTVDNLILFGGRAHYGDKIFLDKTGFFNRFPTGRPENFRGLVVSGDSMRPAFCDGDRMLIDVTKTDPAPGVFVIDICGRLLLRRLKADVFGAVRILADGLPGESADFEADKMRIVGRAVFVWRGEML